MAEAGLVNFVVDGWWALYAPAGTPDGPIQRLAEATNAFLDDPASLVSLQQQGIDSIGGTPAQLASMTREEVLKWRAVIAASGIRVD